MILQFIFDAHRFKIRFRKKAKSWWFSYYTGIFTPSERRVRKMLICVLAHHFVDPKFDVLSRCKSGTRIMFISDSEVLLSPWAIERLEEFGRISVEIKTPQKVQNLLDEQNRIPSSRGYPH